MSPQRIRNIVLPLCAVLLAASCSTTRRLGSDEVLYTGVKKIDQDFFHRIIFL